MLDPGPICVAIAASPIAHRPSPIPHPSSPWPPTPVTSTMGGSQQALGPMRPMRNDKDKPTGDNYPHLEYEARTLPPTPALPSPGWCRCAASLTPGYKYMTGIDGRIDSFIVSRQPSFLTSGRPLLWIQPLGAVVRAPRGRHQACPARGVVCARPLQAHLRGGQEAEVPHRQEGGGVRPFVGESS